MQPYTTEAIIDALKQTNGLVSLAARRLGCSASTIYTRAHNVQAVQQTINDSRDELVDIAELALRSAVTSKEPWAVAMVLKTLGKSRGYVERQEITGAEGGPVEHKVTFDYDNFGAAFDGLIGGHGEGTAAPDGDRKPMDLAGSDYPPGSFPGAAKP